MVYLGYGLSMAFFISLMLLMIFYIITVFIKKYNLANNLILLLFLHSLLVIAVESWCLIIMYQGFDIIFALNVDYTMIFVFAIPVFIVVEVVDFIIRRKIVFNDYKLYSFFRTLLPTLTSLMITVAFGIFYFSTYTFMLLK